MYSKSEAQKLQFLAELMRLKIITPAEATELLYKSMKEINAYIAFKESGLGKELQ